MDLQNDTDIAIRVVLHPDDPESIARPLAQWQTLICISPDYLREHPITQPQVLLNADWLNHNSNVLLHAFKCLGLPEMLPENRTIAQIPHWSHANMPVQVWGWQYYFRGMFHL